MFLFNYTPEEMKKISKLKRFWMFLIETDYQERIHPRYIDGYKQAPIVQQFAFALGMILTAFIYFLWNIL